MSPDGLHAFIDTLGVIVCIMAVGRVGLQFAIDTYYDALARVREREAGLPPGEGV